ncbi:MAG: AAA family ATPase [Candidatus Omnitrophica bacterium]|nr:AAA family ATPase [Candidatus Omnitrophota bacterium]
MSYYKALGLKKEPFSTSPDPEFFFPSASHQTALKRLEIAIRLRRGLSVIIGDVGTGKTTLSRTLMQSFRDENNCIFHMVLDASHESEFQFLLSLARLFGVTPSFRSTIDFKEAIQNYLFQKAVEENKTVVLLIDEAQKISMSNLEVLRLLLNFETNDYKLLQLVIMGQLEFFQRVKRVKNFTDRIALKYTINPLDEKETGDMIDFRLRQAGLDHCVSLFSEEAKRLVYQKTGGYPRRISLLCHDALESAVMRERMQVDADIIEGLLLKEAEV